MNKIKQIVKSKFRTGLKTLPYIAIAILVGITAVYASTTTSLNPSGSASNTMYSLTDIWNLASGTVVSENTGTIEATPTEIVLSGKSLSDVYTALSTEINKLADAKIAKEVTSFGFTGTLYGDTDPTKVLTTATYPGTATAGPATLTWQTDPALQLCWSHNTYEISHGCTVGSGFIQTPDTLATLGAVEYCKYLNANGTTLANGEQDIWHLPTIKEYQSITNFTIYDNATDVPDFTQNSGYWSSSEHAENTFSAWLWGTYYGDIGSFDKYYKNPVRCVH